RGSSVRSRLAPPTDDVNSQHTKDLKRGGVEAVLVFFENWQTSDKRLGSNRTETCVEARNRWFESIAPRRLGVIWSSDQAYTVDALAVRGDEGRGSLRKVSGSWQQALIRQCPNGETHRASGIRN